MSPHDSESAAVDPLAPLRGQLREDGWLEELGPRHLAVFQPRGATLMVEFEALAPLLRRKSAETWSAGLARERDWSTLTIVSRGRTWFRDQAVFDFFDDLTDGGFFDEYDNVVFVGAGVKGYAAAAFSVAAPGATVFLCAPFATLDPSETPWEHRFRGDRHLSFGPRYGYAPDMVDAAARVYVVSDPTEPADAMHASLFRGAHVTHLRARHGGPRLGARLEAMGLLDQLLSQAERGTLTPQLFAQAWRARHGDEVWMSNMLRKLDTMRRPWLQAVFAGAVYDRTGAASARRRLNEALARLKEQGRRPPAGREPAPDGEGRRLLLAGE